MKTRLITTVICAFLSVAFFTSCGSDDDWGEDAKMLSYDGKTYPIEDCEQLYYGTRYMNADWMTIMLNMHCSNRISISFFLHVPAQFKSLQAGTYATFPAYYSGTLWRAEVSDGFDEGTGKVVVAQSGEEYTVTFSGKVKGKAISGTFTGKIPWYDYRD